MKQYPSRTLQISYFRKIEFREIHKSLESASFMVLWMAFYVNPIS